MNRIMTQHEFEKFCKKSGYHIHKCPCGCDMLFVSSKTESNIIDYSTIEKMFGERIETFKSYENVLFKHGRFHIPEEFIVEEKPLFMEIENEN